jgi:opacity protein-like surface antigen
MKNVFCKTWLVAPVTIGVALTVSGHAFAETSSAEVARAKLTSDVVANSVSSSPTQLAQVTSVSELSDVQPGDWAFTALQRLVEEYGCLEGYPDRTYRGNRALTRYEFAAGLNACLDVVIQLIGEGSQLDEIRRLQEEFAAELATIRGRVDTLEADVAELEANQFSTTTKLRGQLDAHLVVPFDELEDEEDGGEVVTFEYRARLNFDTSFTGEDRLRLRLQASDRGTPSSLRAVAGGLADQSGPINGLEDNVGLDDIYYEFPVGDRLSVELAANSRSAGDLVSSRIVPYAGPAVAEFGEDGFYESAFDQDSSLGIGLNYELTDNIVLDLAYSTENGNDNDVGIFNNYEYLVQLNYLSDGLIDAAVTYQDGEVEGSTIDYVIAGLLNLDLGRFQVGGYYAFIEDDAGNSDEWQVGISVPDFLAADNELGIYGGVDSDPESDPVIIEGFYAISVTDFLTITPAVIYGDLDTGADDDSGVYGVVRTTFNF